MGKVDIKRTELVWKGKYDDEGKLAPLEKPGPYPFQIVEVVNTPRIGQTDNIIQSSLFDTWNGSSGKTFDEGWKNKLIWGDNKFVMSSLLDEFGGEVDLIYIDPPFATGADFRASIEIGDKGNELMKGHSIIEEKAYRDTWGQGLDSFLQMLYDRLFLMKELLRDNGQLWVHLDDYAGHYIKVILDEIFGINNFLNEIVWYYPDNFQGNVNRYADNHNVIYLYGKSEKTEISRVKILLDKPVQRDKRVWDKELQKIVAARNEDGKIIYEEYKDKWADNVWTIGQSSVSKEKSKEKLGYPTQKPEELLKRIILSHAKEDSLIADFFCGSGTTCAVAEKLGRRWIGVDLGRYAVHTTRKRLLEIEFSKSLTNEGKEYGQKAKPFEILNLGKYERQFWQVKAFNRKDDKQALFEYLAFILKLYGAEPIAGSQFVHGKKGSSLVYIGAVDSPVTIQEVQDALSDTKSMGMKELHVLGWEWEMGLNDAIQGIAKQMGIRLMLRIIPMDVLNEQAINKKDIKFFELAYFKADLKVSNKKLTVTLQDFVIPHTDLIPEEVQKSITKWSDWIDYWAVDFDFQNDTFNNTWTSYRTKQNRKLVLTSEKKYDNPGKFKVFVKIIDIFGIDTSQVFEISVK